MARDCAAFGIDPPARIAEAPAIWSSHLPALEAFVSVANQWRTAPMGGGFRITGLDYAAVQAGLTLAQITLTPAEWADFRVIEQAAKAALNGG